MLPALSDITERSRALQKLALLRTKLGATRSRRLTAERCYAQRIIEKLGAMG